MCNMRLLDKYIGDIKGEFYVPDYQRGYRWGKTEKITGGTFIKKHTLLSASSVQAAMKKLLDLDLITTDNGYYTIPDHFFSLYIRKLMECEEGL